MYEVTKMRKPIVIYDSQGPQGNIYYILGLVQQALKAERRYTDFNNLRDRVFEARSYEEALTIINETITLIDTSK